MASSKTDSYNRGEMDISEQSRIWSGFLGITTWSCMIIILTVGYATVVLGMHVDWMIALVGFLILGAGLGALLKMGLAWTLTLFGLTFIAVFIRFMVFLTGLAL